MEPRLPTNELAASSDADLAVLPTLRTGIYRHYKGGFYYVVGVVRHSEDVQPMVLYRALYGAGGLWVRPFNMFVESLPIDGVVQPRFAWHKEATGAQLDALDHLGVVHG